MVIIMTQISNDDDDDDENDDECDSSTSSLLEFVLSYKGYYNAERS